MKEKKFKVFVFLGIIALFGLYSLIFIKLVERGNSTDKIVKNAPTKNVVAFSKVQAKKSIYLHNKNGHHHSSVNTNENSKDNLNTQQSISSQSDQVTSSTSISNPSSSTNSHVVDNDQETSNKDSVDQTTNVSSSIDPSQASETNEAVPPNQPTIQVKLQERKNIQLRTGNGQRPKPRRDRPSIDIVSLRHHGTKKVRSDKHHHQHDNKPVSSQTTATTTEVPGDTTATTTEVPADTTATTTDVPADTTSTTTEVPADTTATTIDVPADTTSTQDNSSNEPSPVDNGESHIQNAIRMNLLMRKGYWNINLAQIRNNKNYKKINFISLQKEAKLNKLNPDLNAIDTSLIQFIQSNLHKEVDPNNKLTRFFENVLKLKREYVIFSHNQEFWNNYKSFSDIAADENFKKTVNWNKVEYNAREYIHQKYKGPVNWEKVNEKFKSKRRYEKKYFNLLNHLQKKYQIYFKTHSSNQTTGISNESPVTTPGTDNVVTTDAATTDADTTDAATSDATTTDAATTDAATSDVSTTDAATTDAATTDAATTDAATTDAATTDNATTDAATTDAATTDAANTNAATTDAATTDDATTDSATTDAATTDAASTDAASTTNTNNENAKDVNIDTNSQDNSAAVTSTISLIKKSTKNYCTFECLNICKDNYKTEKDFFSCAKSACLCQNSEEIFSSKI